MTQVAMPVPGDKDKERSDRTRVVPRSGYLVIVAVMTTVVLAGFWPYYSALVSGEIRLHWVVHIHGAVFSGWMLLLLTQVVLVLRRRTDVHQRLGRFGIYYGLLVLLLGLVITIVAPVQSVLAGRSTLDRAAGFLIEPLGDMVLFGGFLAAGIAYRRNVVLHKRLMVLATVALLYPPAARFAADFGLGPLLAIWLLPLGLAMAHDAITRGRIERVYLVGAAILFVGFFRVFLGESELWLPVGRGLLLPWLPAP